MRFAKKQLKVVGVNVLKLSLRTMCLIVFCRKRSKNSLNTYVPSSTQTLFSGRLSPAYSMKVKVSVSESYVAMYLELEAFVCATMPAGRNNNMSNIIGNRANLRIIAPPIVHMAAVRPIGLIGEMIHKNYILFNGYIITDSYRVANIVFFFEIRCRIPPLLCRIPTKKVSPSGGRRHL